MKSGKYINSYPITLDRSDPRDSSMWQHHDSTAERNSVGMHVCVLNAYSCSANSASNSNSEIHILTHKHGFKHLTGFADVAHAMCLLDAWLSSENVIVFRHKDVLLLIVFYLQ